MHTGDWAKNRQASQLHTKDSWEHLQAGNVQPINQLMFMESKTDQVTLDFEPISIIPILGREEACWLLWVCHWPRVFWEHSEKPPLLIFHLNFHSKYFALKVENMFHVSFLVKQRVVCLTVRCTWCNYHTILVNILHIFQQISPSGWWWSGSAFPGASVRWVRWRRSWYVTDYDLMLVAQAD